MATNDDRDERLYGFVRWIAKAGKEQALRDELMKLVPNARKDPGNISYDLFTPADQPAMTYLFEVWADRASVEAHAKQPYVQDMIAAVPDLLAEPYTAILTGMLSASDEPPGHSVAPGAARPWRRPALRRGALSASISQRRLRQRARRHGCKGHEAFREQGRHRYRG